MNMFGSLRVGARLALSFAVVLGLLLAVAGLALSKMDALSAVTRVIVDDQAVRVVLAEELNQHAQAAATRLLQLLVTTDKEKRIPLYGLMDAENAAVNQGLVELGKRLSAPDEQARLKQLAALRSRYGDLFQETVETIEISGTEAARDHFAAKTEPALAALLKDASALVTEQQQAMHAGRDVLEQQLAQARKTVIALSIAALLLGALLAWAVTRGIVGPVGDAVRLAEAIAQGDLSKPVQAGGSDEIGQLLRALGAMRSGLAGLIGGIRQSAQQVLGAAGDMGAPVARVRSGSDAQQQAVARVTDAVSAFAAQTQAVSSSAAATRQQAELARDLANEGRTLIADASREVEQIAATVAESATAVETLRDRALSVRELLSTVREIADQTNLLALNAAIEAARAGESGRGFAVVADEVRKLADRTSKATGEINEVIDAIDRETDIAVARIGDGRAEMQRGVTLIQRIVTPLTTLSDNAEDSLVQLESLVRSIDTQAAESAAISASIREIGAMAAENLSATQQVASTSGSLTTLSSGLTESVGRFVLADNR
ncbi:MAG TPA: methyl-accepting chemotaxis protein [Rhodocyclaceae bacterium]